MVIVITGPTASHKSDIAIQVAQKLKGEIVNADVFQMFKELTIGTAKPSEEDMKIVPHHLFDFLKPTDRYSIAQYQKDARKVIDEILSKKKTVILVGGSCLYIRAALYDYEFTSEKPIDNSDFDSLTNNELWNELNIVDPKEASKLHPNNRKRVIRALSIYRASGRPKSEIEENQEHKLIYENVYIYSIDLDRKILYENINLRVDKMIEKGLVKEVTDLTKKYGEDLQSLNAIGYKEIIENPNEDTDEIRELIQKNTRNYAKRQITFIKHQFPAIYVKDADDLIYNLQNSSISSRTEMLLGFKNMQKIKNLKIAVIGLGGVGGPAAEALVRCGIKQIGLFDKDVVDITNLNRQVLYTSKNIGESKCEAAKNYLLEINPSLVAKAMKIDVSKFNLDSINLENYDFVLDCIDDVQAKISIYKYLLKQNIPFISSLGMGNRFDVNKLTITTLDKTEVDPLARKIRYELKEQGLDAKTIKVIFSNEKPLDRNGAISSMIFVPSKAGLMMANYCINQFINMEEKNENRKN